MSRLRLKPGETFVCDGNYTDEDGQPVDLSTSRFTGFIARLVSGQTVLDLNVMIDPVMPGKIIVEAPPTDSLTPGEYFIEIWRYIGDVRVATSSAEFTIEPRAW